VHSFQYRTPTIYSISRRIFVPTGFRKVSIVAGSFALAASTVLIAPAQAAVKAGATCTKVNAKAKIGGDQYVCIKNPTVKNAKLTWVWVECVNADKMWKESSTRLTTLKAQAAAAQTKIDTLNPDHRVMSGFISTYTEESPDSNGQSCG